MAILPSFYNQVDQDIYTGGEHYIPREPYRLGYTPNNLASTNTLPGITNTQAAGSYMGYPSYEAWLLAQGGGGGNGGGQDDSITNTYNVNQNLGPTNITDYESEAYGIGPTFQGSIARLQDLYSKLPTPTNLLRKGVMKWRENREIKKQEKAAIEQADGTDGGSSGPSENYGFDDVSGDFTGEGFGSESTGNESTAADSGDIGQIAETYDGWAQGGRIGYNRGRVVNPGGYSGNTYSDFLADKTVIPHPDDKSWRDVFYRWLDSRKAQGGLIGYFDGGIAGLL